jgi:hypothetical protein
LRLESNSPYDDEAGSRNGRSAGESAGPPPAPAPRGDEPRSMLGEAGEAIGRRVRVAARASRAEDDPRGIVLISRRMLWSRCCWTASVGVGRRRLCPDITPGARPGKSSNANRSPCGRAPRPEGAERVEALKRRRRIAPHPRTPAMPLRGPDVRPGNQERPSPVLPCSLLQADDAAPRSRRKEARPAPVVRIRAL